MGEIGWKSGFYNLSGSYGCPGKESLPYPLSIFSSSQLKIVRKFGSPAILMKDELDGLGGV
jgi:hypothetical protein